MDMRSPFLRIVDTYNYRIFRSFNKMEMEDTDVSPTGKALRLGPGSQWGEVLEFAPPSEYSYPHGRAGVQEWGAISLEGE